MRERVILTQGRLKPVGSPPQCAESLQREGPQTVLPGDAGLQWRWQRMDRPLPLAPWESPSLRP